MNYTISLAKRTSKNGADYTVLVLKIKDYTKEFYLEPDSAYILTSLLSK